MIGSTVGHYDIIRKIGGGGMGVVYLARDTRLDRPVALKFVRTRSDPGGARQLLREARAASALNHPGICTVHEVGESGSDAYIVMEYVEGATLSDRMAARPFSPDDVMAIGAQIAAALVHAHRRGAVHRDPKSATIVFGAENRLKVLDFGLSRRTTVVADDVTPRPNRFPTTDCTRVFSAWVPRRQILPAPTSSRACGDSIDAHVHYVESERVVAPAASVVDVDPDHAPYLSLAAS